MRMVVGSEKLGLHVQQKMGLGLSQKIAVGLADTITLDVVWKISCCCSENNIFLDGEIWPPKAGLLYGGFPCWRPGSEARTTCHMTIIRSCNHSLSCMFFDEYNSQFVSKNFS